MSGLWWTCWPWARTNPLGRTPYGWPGSGTGRSASHCPTNRKLATIATHAMANQRPWLWRRHTQGYCILPINLPISKANQCLLKLSGLPHTKKKFTRSHHFHCLSMFVCVKMHVFRSNNNKKHWTRCRSSTLFQIDQLLNHYTHTHEGKLMIHTMSLRINEAFVAKAHSHRKKFLWLASSSLDFLLLLLIIFIIDG